MIDDLQWLTKPAHDGADMPQHRRRANADYVGRLLDEHECGVADHRKLIWTQLMFEMWSLAAN